MNTKIKLVLTFFVLFIAIYFLRFKAIQKNHYKSEDRVIVTGILSQEPILKDNFQILKLGKFYVKAPKYPSYQYGNKLKIAGTIEKRVPAVIKNEIWLIDETILKIDNDKKNLPISIKGVKIIIELRNRLENVIQKSLPEPHASLLTGIILGIQKSLPRDFYNSLKTAGTLHIVVASGMNISLTAGLLKEFLASLVGRKTALILGFLVIIFYCSLAGLSPPIVRAGIMAAILYLSQFLGREADGIWILALTAAIMLIINPQILFDVGFQLSFTATAGLILISPRIKKVFRKTGFFREDLTETTSAMLATAPVLIITFGHFNPLSLIPNALVLWLIPFLMILGLVIMFIGLIFLSLAQVLGLLLWLPLTYFIKVIEFFGQFKFMDFNLEGLSWIFGVGYYLVLISLLISKR